MKIEMARIGKRKVKVIPVVIGALGAYTPSLKNYLNDIPGEHLIPHLVKAALLGSANILRREEKKG